MTETTVQRQAEEYQQGEGRPLGTYLGTLGAYGTLLGGLFGAARLTGRRLPRAVRPGDLLLMACTTHKLSRLIAKDPVLSPLRVPFTRYEGVSAPAELSEDVRGHGVRHGVGELLTCPFCMAQWVATAYVGGLLFAPRATRLFGTIMTAVATADWLQLAYARLSKAPKNDPHRPPPERPATRSRARSRARPGVWPCAQSRAWPGVWSRARSRATARGRRGARTGPAGRARPSLTAWRGSPRVQALGVRLDRGR